MSGSRLAKGKTKGNSLIEPKAVQHLNYNPFKPRAEQYPEKYQLFRLQLRPVLDDQGKKGRDSSEDMKPKKQQEQRQKEDEPKDRSPPTQEKRHRAPRRHRECDESCRFSSSCAQGTDVYRNILGPTPDESILAGLQTVIELCGLADVCHIETDSYNDSRVVTTSSKQSTFYSQDGLSLHKSSSDTSQEDSSSLTRFRCPFRRRGRETTCDPSCSSFREQRDSFRNRPDESQPSTSPSSKMKTECSQPCPFMRSPLCPAFGRPTTQPPPQSQRSASGSPSASLHCALPKCPVPLYLPPDGYDTETEEYDADREKEYQPKSTSARKGTLQPTSPCRLPLRDASIFSTGDSDKSDDSTTTPVCCTDKPIETYDPNSNKFVLDRPKGRRRIVERMVFKSQEYPIVQERHLIKSKGATATKYDTVLKGTLTHGMFSQEYYTSQEKYEATRKPTAREYHISRKGSVTQRVNPQTDLSEHPRTDASLTKYETAQREHTPALVADQNFEKLSGAPQYPLVEATLGKYANARKQGSARLITSTKSDIPKKEKDAEPSESHSAHEGFIPSKKDTKESYDIAKRKRLPETYAPRQESVTKESHLVPIKKDTKGSYEIAKKTSLTKTYVPHEEKATKDKEPTQSHSAHRGFIPVKKDTKESYEIAKRKSLTKSSTSSSERVSKSGAPTESHSAHQGFIPVKKDTKGSYEIARRKSLTRSCASSKETAGKSEVPTESHSAHQGFVPIKKEPEDSYEIARRKSLTKSFASSKEKVSKTEVPTVSHSAHQGFIPVKKDTRGSYEIARRKSLTKSRASSKENVAKREVPTACHSAHQGFVPVKKDSKGSYEIARRKSLTKSCASSKETAAKSEVPTASHSAHQGFVAVRKDTKESYQIAKRQSVSRSHLPTKEAVLLYDTLHKTFMPQGILVLDYRTPQESIAPSTRKTVEKYRVARTISRSEMISLENKDKIVVYQAQSAFVPSQKEIARSRSMSLARIGSQTSQEPKQIGKVVKRIETIKQESNEGGRWHDKPLPHFHPPHNYPTSMLHIQHTPGSTEDKNQCRAWCPSLKRDSPTRTFAKPTPQNEFGKYEDPKREEKSETYDIKHKPLSKSLSSIHPFENAEQAFIPKESEKSQAYKMKQTVRPTAVKPSDDIKEGYVIMGKDHKKKYYMTESAFVFPEHIGRSEQRPICDGCKSSCKPMQVAHPAPDAYKQPYKDAEKKESGQRSDSPQPSRNLIIPKQDGEKYRSPRRGQLYNVPEYSQADRSDGVDEKHPSRTLPMYVKKIYGITDPVVSEGGIVKVRKFGRCTPSEKGMTHDLPKEDRRPLQQLPRFFTGRIKRPFESSSCPLKLRCFRDLRENLQPCRLPPDRPTSEEMCDKCCGPSPEEMPDGKQKPSKELGRESGESPKGAPDLIAQSFPPVNLPSNNPIPSESDQYICTDSNLLSDRLRIPSDTSTKSADSSSSGCCSSKGSSSKSSTKSKSSKRGGKKTCSVCKKEQALTQNERDKSGSQKSVVVQDPKNLNSSSLFDGKFICNKDYVFPPGSEKKPKDFRTSRMSIPPAVQPVIGVCTDGRCGTTTTEKLLNVRYSIVRISTFTDYTTYEILKSSAKKPKKLPGMVEGIFVTKR